MNDVFLIGPQHFDLSISEVREKLTEISEMRDVIAKDLWDANYSAHTQVIDLSRSTDATAQVGALLLTASLSTAVNAVKGLTREEIVESLVMPNRKPSEFLEAFEELTKEAWYLHHTQDDRYYFDRQENLTKLLQSLAGDAPENKVDELICHRITEMYKPVRKSAYEEVLALPKLDQIADRVRRSRVLLVVSPDSKLPPAAVLRFFEGLSQKNNLCVLTGDKTQMASVEKVARHVFAADKADSRIPKGHPQRDELERKQAQYGQDFNSTVLNVFDKVLFPIHRSGKMAELVSKPLEMSRDNSKPFNGEDQIEKTLVSDPKKLFLDIEKDFDSIREKAELLWPENQLDVRWSDVIDSMSEHAGFSWLPPKGAEQLKFLAFNRGRWEDLGNGYITKCPKKKKTSVQVTSETEPDDTGEVRLRIIPINAGPSPKIYYAEDNAVTTKSKVLEDSTLNTSALRVYFLVVDPSEQFETGEPTKWENRLIIRNELIEEKGIRYLRLVVSPTGNIKYSLDGSEPRNGIEYSELIRIGDAETRLMVFAEADGLEARDNFIFQAKGKKGVQIDDTKPAKVTANKGPKRLDSRQKTFSGLQAAKEMSVNFEAVMLTIGEGAQNLTITVSPDVPVDGLYLEVLLNAALNNKSFPLEAPITLTFKKASFKSGYDLRKFTEDLGIELQDGEVQQ